ncbi:FAD-dependent monooxygenase [Chroococcidiopsidales cyanobacterium LEGE 13417]|nr:FAD-dependent monooxygenase [Chroococcidiopsidales cyanobacterium LEGE 13417]
MTNDTQVIIVGAGPTGATLALLLVKRGITVKLVEASRNFRRAFRGEGLMPSGLDALEQMGLSSMLERIPHQTLNAWEFLIEGRSLFRVDEPIESGGKPCTLVSQPALLKALIDESSTYANFEFVQNAPVQDLLWRDGRVSGVKLGSGEIYADLVVAADGRNSIVRQRANLSLEQKSQSFDILWFKLADSPHFESENIFYSILQGHHAFGLFCSSEGNLQLGWALRDRDSVNWKQVDDWSEILASASPPWLAKHLRQNAKTIDRPVLLSVVVGRCLRWYTPGLLLLGDAAHPMSPIRAQGINMALRDIIVAANHLVGLLQEAAEHTAIDAALPKIQAEREPEIIRVQQLQSQEAAQADLLEKSAFIRWGASSLAPLLRYPIRQSWIARQRQLRQGVTRVELIV